jgi:hypothetical protein
MCPSVRSTIKKKDLVSEDRLSVVETLKLIQQVTDWYDGFVKTRNFMTEVKFNSIYANAKSVDYYEIYVSFDAKWKYIAKDWPALYITTSYGPICVSEEDRRLLKKARRVLGMKAEVFPLKATRGRGGRRTYTARRAYSL